MEKGKWVGVKLTRDQRTAQKLIQRGLKERGELCDALKTSLDSLKVKTRGKMHERLDWNLDRLEKMHARAIALFPEVEESMTIATFRLVI
mgnify:CR=1 FL=1